MKHYSSRGSGLTGWFAGALLLATQMAWGGPQADQALTEVRKLIASNEIPQRTTLRVAFKPGNIAALLGPELEIQKDWERLTGILISAQQIPQQAALLNLKNNTGIDITVARTHEFPDLLDQKLVEDLTPYLKQFNFELPFDGPNGYVRPRLQGAFGQKIVAIPADGDVTIFYVRKDLLESPQEKAAFHKRFGRELKAPVTWAEYDQLVQFFHRPEQGLYGTTEERDLSGGWMLWLPRYLQQATAGRRMFDDDMRPLISSPEGIAATESYVRTVKYSPPEILQDGRDYSYTLPIFLQGKAFATVNTIAGAKLFNSPNSAVKGKFMAIALPGTRVGKELIRHNVPIYGNNLVISSQSAQRKLAFLFTMWLTDPDNSLRTVGVRGGHTDPYRWHHLKDPRIIDLYTTDALSVFRSEWERALPPGTGVAADAEYLDVLDRHLWLAASGQLSAREAMTRTAGEWEKITHRVGREKQILLLRTFLTGFSPESAIRPLNK